MLFPHLTVLLEILGACLLAAVLVYAVRLNRLLAGLKADKTELERLAQTFHQATSRAELSVAKLRTSAAEVAQALQTNVEKAEKLRDDLTFMVDRANDRADRLEAAIAAARHSPAAAPPAAETARTASVQAAEAGTTAVHGGRAVLRSTTRVVAARRPAEPPTAADAEAEAGRRRRTKSELLKALEGMR